ncbi:MAG: PIN domain-containing protein [Bacilli bacterium]|nr:PIN domain-containing protein [Bacilli bacterium]
MRVLVDSNVFLDFFLTREPFYGDAVAFFHNCWGRKNQIYVTSMTLRDIEYIAHHFTHSKKVAKEMALRTYQIASKVIGIEADDAICAMLDHEGDLEDAMQMEAAERSFADAIITNDKKGFSDSKVPVFSPKQINQIWARHS